MKKTIIKAITSITLAALALTAVPFAETVANTNILSVSSSAATVCRRVQLTQAEYDSIVRNWNAKGCSYLGYDLYPSAAKKACVRDIQSLLNKIMGTSMSVDGLFGNGTRTNVLAFQRANGLYADGLFGNASFQKALSYVDIVSVPATISYSNIVVPSQTVKNRSYDLKGTISCSKPLSYVTARIINSNNDELCTKTVYTSAYSLNIQTSLLNTYMKFGSLSEGSYRLVYNAVASDGTSKTASYNFVVKGQTNNSNSQSQKLNMNSALNYAKIYWNKLDPQNGFYTSNGAKTYDPSRFITNGNNCANYVSAILLSAGRKTDSTWYRGSSAWINVNSMRNYFVNQGIKYISYPSSSQIEAGDILYTSSGHVMFVTSATPSDSGKIICATGNTNSRDINFRVTSFYGVIKTSTLF